MKYKVLSVFFLFSLFFLGNVSSLGLEINTTHDKIWLGEDLGINCWYTGNISDNTTLSDPWIYIEETSQNKTPVEISPNFYQSSYRPPILGTYNAFCSDGSINSPDASFQVRTLNISINEIPDVVFLGENFVIKASVTEHSDSESTISSTMSFNIFLDDEKLEIIEDQTYFLNGEWVITTENVTYEDFEEKVYTLLLESEFDGKKTSDERMIEIKEPIEFEVAEIDKRWIKSERNITLKVKASKKGKSIYLSEDHLKIYVKGNTQNIIDISQLGNYYYVKVSIPNLNPGTYDLKVRFSYDDIVIESIHKLSYVVIISGKVIDASNKGVKTDFMFRKGGDEIKITSSSSGSYSGELPPGDYDLNVVFPESRVIFKDIYIDDFDDPIKFDHPGAEGGIQGIGTIEIYAFESDLDYYDDVELSLEYSEKGISDESAINYVYKCDNWSFGSRKCNGKWVRITDVDFDYVRNLVKFEQDRLSTFLIGHEKRMVLDAGSDRNKYYLNEFIRITGYTEDDDNKPLSDSKITATVKGTSISEKTYSDANGVFSIEIQAPDREGAHEIVVKAEKSPMDSVEKSFTVNLIKSEELSILGPDSLKLDEGGEETATFSLVNTGQTAFSDLEISLSGLPENYYILTLDHVSNLGPGKETSIPVDFIIPQNLTKETFSGVLKVNYGDTHLEKKFLLTISKKMVAQATTIEESGNLKVPDINLLPSGKFVLPSVNLSSIWIAGVAVISFSVAFFLKKLKLGKKTDRSDVKTLLFNIRDELNRKAKEEKDRYTEDKSYG